MGRWKYDITIWTTDSTTFTGAWPLSGCYKELPEGKPRYLEDLCLICKEIEKAIYELEEKQQLALSQWRETDEQEKTRILFPLTDGLEQMSCLVEKKGCKAVGEYLESFIMNKILELLDSSAWCTSRGRNAEGISQYLHTH